VRAALPCDTLPKVRRSAIAVVGSALPRIGAMLYGAGERNRANTLLGGFALATGKPRGIMTMRLQSIAVFTGLAWAAATGAATAHHSFAMFDAAHPIEISGTVKEFRFVSPHTILVVEVKGKDGAAREWILEGGAPGMLVRAGVTANSLKPGDEITATINPLHSGADGGSYNPQGVKFKDGRSIGVER
jgi:hypothetical protein